jgi:hypothetical protein
MVHWNKYRFFVIHKPLLNDTDMFVHVTSCLFLSYQTLYLFVHAVLIHFLM